MVLPVYMDAAITIDIRDIDIFIKILEGSKTKSLCMYLQIAVLIINIIISQPKYVKIITNKLQVL